MEVNLIPTEKLDSIQADLSEIKIILHQKKEEEEKNQWVSKKQAKDRLHVCLKTLDNYLLRGILPYSKFAGKIYLKASDIEAHLQRNYITKR